MPGRLKERGAERERGVTLKGQGKRRRRGYRLRFFCGFLRRPAEVGSVVASSRSLERRLVAAAAVAGARLVVELGPGTGGTTQAILDALPPGGRLLVIEINPDFAALLSAHPDPRLIVHHGSAAQLGETLAHYGLSLPEAVISGIPFSTMSSALGRHILHGIWSCLAPGGRFVAYQFRQRVALLGRDLLGRPVTEVELRNLPPVRVFRWGKPAGIPEGEQ